jgi:hypothetical protein
MTKPFNIHDWQAKQKQQRLDEQYYVTVNRGRGGGKRLVRSAESDYEEPRVFSNYGEAEKYIKQAKSGGATPGQITSYWVSDENMNRIEDPVVAKGDGLEITQDEMDKLHRDGRVRLKDGSLLVFPSKPLNVKEEDMNESLNPEVSRSLDKFIRAMADRYDYTMQDAVYAIMAALKQRNYDGLGEASMTGTGASFNAGSGEGYMSPNAFGDDKKKKMKAYKSIGYKKV